MENNSEKSDFSYKITELAATEESIINDSLVRERTGKFKILGVVCSPRKNGNVQIMMETALAAAKEEGADTELVLLSGKDIRPCDACESCQKTHKCHVKDDMQGIFPKLWEADAIIIGSPTYGLSISSLTRCFLDRATGMHAEWMTSTAEKKGRGFSRTIGAAIVVAGRCGASLASMNIIGEFALGQWIFAGAAWGYAWNKGDIKKDTIGLDEARALGKRVYKFVNQWSKP